MNPIRISALNLRLLTCSFEDSADNAIYRGNEREADAYNDALLHLLRAADVLTEAADEIEGVWTAPPCQPVLVGFEERV